MVVLEGSELIHTNHFLHADFVGRDELNPFARTSSLRRFEACRLALERLPVDAEAQSYFDMLQKPPIYVQPDGDVRRECTVASVVMRPDLGAMFVKQAASDHSLASSSRGIPQPV
jgi:hypothetical protein